MTRISEDSFTIRNMTKGKLPSLPFARIKNAILGQRYVLSLVITSNALSQKLNRTYRGKNKPTDILSFSLDKSEGEIFINPTVVRKKMAQFGRTYPSMIGFLFIHGLLHLKGMQHSSKMESEEQRYCKRFKL